MFWLQLKIQKNTHIKNVANLLAGLFVYIITEGTILSQATCQQASGIPHPLAYKGW